MILPALTSGMRNRDRHDAERPRRAVGCLPDAGGPRRAAPGRRDGDFQNGRSHHGGDRRQMAGRRSCQSGVGAGRAAEPRELRPVHGHALAVMQPTGIFRVQVPGASPAPLSGRCMPLPSGHRRRIFFGFEDVAVNGTQALGYEEVDVHGAVVPGTQRRDSSRRRGLAARRVDRRWRAVHRYVGRRSAPLWILCNSRLPQGQD